MQVLNNKGNFKHNIKVLRGVVGEENEKIIVLRRQGNQEKQTNNRDYLPCPHCLGFCKKTELWRHIKSCEQIDIAQSGLDDPETMRDWRVGVTASAKLTLDTAMREDEGDQRELVSIIFINTYIFDKFPCATFSYIYIDKFPCATFSYIYVF